MYQYFEKIRDIYNSGDEEIRTWFLVQNNVLPFILCGFYALFATVIGPSIMKNRKPYDLRKLMIAFNFFLVATYSVALLLAMWYLPYLSMEQFCVGCVVRKGDVTYILARAGWVVYLLKYAQFLDTVFFTLRKKENLITFLHVMHHTVLPILGWTFLRTERSGFQGIPVMINSFVHVVMYSYYGLAAMGPEVRKYLWWKKYLTQLQMIQFCLIMLIALVVAPYYGCRMVITSVLFDLIFCALFLYLFFKFYQSRYQLRHRTADEIHCHNGQKYK